MIYKYTVVDLNSYKRNVLVNLPTNYKILSVGVQGSEVVVWADVDGNQFNSVEFIVAETGTPTPDDNYRFLDTVGYNSGRLILHVFVKEPRTVTNVPVPPRPASMGGTTKTASNTPVVGVPFVNALSMVDYPDVPPGGLVFNYRKKSGEVRLMRLNHVQFHVNVANGKQQLTGYDVDRKDMRTVYLDSIVNFPAISM